MNNNEQKRIPTPLRLLSILAIIFTVISAGSVLVLLGMIVTFLIVKSGPFIEALTSSIERIFLQGSLIVRVDQYGPLAEATYSKPSIIFYLFTLLIYSLLIGLIAYVTYKFVKNVQNDQLLTVENSRYITNVGYLFVGLTFIDF